MLAQAIEETGSLVWRWRCSKFRSADTTADRVSGCDRTVFHQIHQASLMAIMDNKSINLPSHVMFFETFH